MHDTIDRVLEEGALLWTPSQKRVDDAQLTQFRSWLTNTAGLTFDSYSAMWTWSISEREKFWTSIWDYFGVMSDGEFHHAISGEGMIGAKWFVGAKTNYAEHLLRQEAIAPDGIAICYSSETIPATELTWSDLGNRVRAVATQLRALGIKPGDRVVSYMPNTPETAVAMIATVAIGAVWSAAAPEFGADAVVERFAQIGPKLLFAADGYRFGGLIHDRRTKIASIIERLPSLETVVHQQNLGLGPMSNSRLVIRDWNILVGGPAPHRNDFKFERLAFDHPLWVLYSSGTTGRPKAIVHGHTGMILEHLKSMVLHMDLGPGKRMFFFTTTGWMVWNSVIASLISGATAVLYDGSPVFGGIDALWRMAAETRTTSFGASPMLVQKMKEAGVEPSMRFDLSCLDTVTLAGAPATPETYGWLYRNVKQDLWVASQSGGTDLCSALVISAVTEPVYAGEIQVRPLGIDTHVWDADGLEVVDEVGELVVTAPFPSAPLCFWGDADSARLEQTYFSTYPGVWRHGDFAKINHRGGAYIYGRSDATLNRHGVRIGTAEIYRVIEQIKEVVDSLVVCIDRSGNSQLMILFVVLSPNLESGGSIIREILTRLQVEASPRHVPDEVVIAPGIPYTRTGKKMEVPVKRLLNGLPADQATSRQTMSDPGSLDWYVEFYRELMMRWVHVETAGPARKTASVERGHH